MSELERLRRSDIPAGRERLREQHGNLLRVADYCHSNYLQAGDKRKALQETMALSTQSLASVTYQVSSLASAFLRLLELQAAQLRRVEADIACVAQSVDIHKEKVARREIGALTVTKRLLSHQKVVAPPEPPVLEPYYRKPLSFSVLDHIGHGVKVSAGGWAGISLSPCPLRGAWVAETPPLWRRGSVRAHSALGAWHPQSLSQLWKTPQEGFGVLRAPKILPYLRKPHRRGLGSSEPQRSFPTSENPTGGVWGPQSPTSLSQLWKPHRRGLGSSEPQRSFPTSENPTGGVWDAQSPTSLSQLWKTPQEGFGVLRAP
ncbi:ABI gene family member 3 isoform X2 [Passer montanus]|uniref:ABI gene family member 3 isoform X2 n=1 Tax=Passer montanus TaxID=9160 RepID=UPI00195FAC31|nr:ABI gene family member 3 isoform X2 [Passer montanus]